MARRGRPPKHRRAQLTWLGADDEPEETEWNGIVFRRGEKVVVEDQAMIKKASNNRFFTVEIDK